MKVGYGVWASLEFSYDIFLTWVVEEDDDGGINMATAQSAPAEGRKRSVADIVVERLIEKIQTDKILPWQRPFQTPCMNWYSEREYVGINRFLLGGGEYITFKQLQEYNRRHGTDFSVKGLKTHIVVFYTKREKLISDEKAAELIKKGFARIVRPTDNGWVRIYWILRYYRVFNILDIPPDSNGNRLEPKLGKTVFEVHTPAEEIVKGYLRASGVKIIRSDSGAWYDHLLDAVGLPEKRYFKSQEAYYRVLFHELIHSTGVENRLNRECFKQYHKGSRDRSREEFIAEIGGLLLATEAGFREDTEWAQNSMEYVHGWCAWMRDHKNEVLNGMLAAEKAKNYILQLGGNVPSEQLDQVGDAPEVTSDEMVTEEDGADQENAEV